MAPKWTSQQLKAIQPADRLTVLSAAAGSGKTTVLVARALNLLLDKENPVSAEKMLIVTFSNASAAEFKKRIEKGINEKIRENPDDNYIKMQKVALQKADISTIHAFCIKLVRENFQSLDISPDFTICDDAQSNLLHTTAIDMAMNYGYGLDDFKELVSFYGKSSSDAQIRDFLRQMDYFFSALPHPHQNAELMAENYGKSLEMADSPAYRQLTDSLKLQADYLIYLAGRMDEIYQMADFTGYDDGIEDVKRYAVLVQNATKQENDSAIKAILSAPLPKLGRAKPACDESKTIKDNVYKEFTKTVENMADIAEYLDSESYKNDILSTDKYVKVLFNVYLKYQQYLMEIKKERKTFEFSDFEHFALELLQNEDGSPTALAVSLRESYEYIMEDEFQDTSFVQDAIFTMIARENQANLYVVGDVKQSIYGFRKASPEIFLAKRQIGLDNETMGSTIFLPHNFRSSYTVIEGVNYIFARLMSRLVGGVEYDDSEKLATLKENDFTTGLQLNIYQDDEAGNTARRISEMIKNGYEIDDGGIKRPVKSGDFCILMRNAKHFGEYKAALEKLGFEAFVRDDELILNKPEVQSVINLLKAVSNPLQEVYLTATMFGDIFGFNLDEILKIRADHSEVNLYKALALADNPKAGYMLAMLKDFSYLGGVYSADKLIDYICKKTGYYQRLAFTADGSEKRENIRWFISFARNWAKTHPSDLAAFLRWVDMYIQTGKGGTSDTQQSENAIAIMTMHTSKGLEFPVVFVTGLTTKFNKQDKIKRLMLDTQLGIGMYANHGFGYNHSTLNIAAIRNKIDESLASEEMRLLYVAFTRSKNLLVLSGSYSRSFSAATLAKITACTGRRPHPAMLRSATTPMHWVLAAFSGHPALADQFSYGKEDKNIPQCISINLSADGSTPQQEETQQTVEKVTVAADMDRITANIGYVYPHLARTQLPIKMSVSEIAKSTPVTLAKPDFIREGKATAAEKGTAMHRFAQHADILLARTNLENEINRLEKEGKIDPQLLNIPAIEKFIFSDVANMIINSEKVYTEKDFLVPYSAARALGDMQYSEDEVMVQGVMDCVLQNGDEITIIDYKTDFIYNIDQLVKRYRRQLELYRHGAKQLFDTDKVKCILYSFHLDEYIEF
ncbi:MAG: UvrD-helicase domain-containing protein [Oscillospiraceae bacterium]|nr:UvrD-helicase domain-containing protein [Oscillospiraceae bacterium]